jgi:hypothetical protein
MVPNETLLLVILVLVLIVSGKPEDIPAWWMAKHCPMPLSQGMIFATLCGFAVNPWRS